MPNKNEMVDRPDAPRGYGYSLYLCGDPECGPHIYVLDDDGMPLAEMVLGQEGVNSLISVLVEIKNEKGWKDQ